MIYLDHAATTPLDPRVAEVMRKVQSEIWGNPSSPHALGQAARLAVENARKSVAEQLGVRSHEVIFTSSGTESNNLALLGIAEKWLEINKKPGHIITSTVEHSCILKTAAKLEAQGWQVTYLPADETGMVDVSELEAALDDQTALVSIQWANNEVGTIQPISKIHELCQAAKAPFHCDAVQGIGWLELPDPLPELFTISAHKFYGPKGVATLIVRDEVALAPQIVGGDQELNLRAGTESVANIVGLAEALKLSLAKQSDTFNKVKPLRDELETSLLRIDGISLNGHPTERLPHFLNLSVPLESEALLIKLDQVGICASSGSACTAGSPEPSHVLKAMGQSDTASKGNIRLSLGKASNESGISKAINELKDLLC